MTKVQKVEQTSIADWGKDHFSLLGYLMSCAADYKVATPLGLRGGSFFSIDRKHLRANEKTHPLLVSAPGRWKDEYGTRLRGFFLDAPIVEPGYGTKTTDLGRQLIGHDDWDCLDDLAVAGLVEIASLVNGICRLTKKGLALGARLMVHKASGGHFATFDPDARRKASKEVAATIRA